MDIGNGLLQVQTGHSSPPCHRMALQSHRRLMNHMLTTQALAHVIHPDRHVAVTPCPCCTSLLWLSCLQHCSRLHMHYAIHFLDMMAPPCLSAVCSYMIGVPMQDTRSLSQVANHADGNEGAMALMTGEAAGGDQTADAPSKLGQVRLQGAVTGKPSHCAQGLHSSPVKPILHHVCKLRLACGHWR